MQTACTILYRLVWPICLYLILTHYLITDGTRVGCSVTFLAGWSTCVFVILSKLIMGASIFMVGATNRLVFHDVTLTLWMCVCVEIAFHTFLTSESAGIKYEVSPVINRHIQTSPQCTTDEAYQLHASTTSRPQDIFLNPLQSIPDRWTLEQISTQYWWQFSCHSQESNSFTYVYLQRPLYHSQPFSPKPGLNCESQHQFKTIL